MNEAGNATECGRLDIVDAEKYAELRKENLEMSIELEKLRGKVERLYPYRSKWLDKVKSDLLAEYNLPEEQREHWKERIDGNSEEEIKAAVEKLHHELRLDAKPKYVDPSYVNPPVRLPVANNSLYSVGQEAAKKVLGVKPEQVPHVPERTGNGQYRSSVHIPRRMPKRSERYRNNSPLYQFGRALYNRLFRR